MTTKNKNIETAYQSGARTRTRTSDGKTSAGCGRIKRIHIANNYYTLKSSIPGIQIIYQAITEALQSDWFEQLADLSRHQIISMLRTFLAWVDDYSSQTDFPIDVLRDYETYRVNEMHVKPQSTGISLITTLIRTGLQNRNLRSNAISYLHSIINRCVLAVEDRNPDTISRFFTDCSWLKQFLSPEDNYSLESPKRLAESFSITIATTLFIILTEKQHLLDKTVKNPKSIRWPTEKSATKREAQDKWCLGLLSKYSNICNSKRIEDVLTELFILDFVETAHKDLFLEKWITKKKKERSSIRPILEGKRYNVIKTPELFHPDYIKGPSRLEQLLFVWLCAWLAIQPTDIYKLRRENFVITKKTNNSPATIQCVYYKGRSGGHQKTEILDANSIEAKAIILYLSYLSDNDPAPVVRISRTLPILSFDNHMSYSSRLHRLWTSSLLRPMLQKEILKRSSTFLFINAYNAMATHSEESMYAWDKRQRKSSLPSGVEKYRSSVKFPIPMKIFGLSAIKNTSVYARTDRYRSNDLINVNSHSPRTEHISYLTDSNQQWVNQYGRLTRLVMHDIADFVYKPNIDKSIDIARDLIFRTHCERHNPQKSLDTQYTNRAFCDSNGNMSLSDVLRCSDKLLVLETEETVVYMLHVVNEAKKNHKIATKHNPIFFEETVLPIAEWMDYILQHMMTPRVLKRGISQYESIKAILPELFIAELRGGDI